MIGRNSLHFRSCKILKFDAVKTLWFTAANGGKGRALVELKDAVQSLSHVFSELFSRFSDNPADGMTLRDFRKFVTKSECGIDESFIDSNFYECTKYPEDEDDEQEIMTIVADVAGFTSAVVRIANALTLQNTGGCETGLREQLIEWLTLCAAALGIPSEKLHGAVGEQGIGLCARDSSFFSPPFEFKDTMPRVYLDLAIAENDIGRVEIELNGHVMPKTSYNFLCLCTGRRGLGEVTGLPLCYRGSCFHRVVRGMCVQGGDIADQSGYGGESIYGGEFEDEGFKLLHDVEGVVSMGNMGPDTNTSQFFITVGSAPHLDNENCAFGKVVSGMEHVKRINALPVDDDEKPLQLCFIKDCGIVN